MSCSLSALAVAPVTDPAAEDQEAGILACAKRERVARPWLKSEAVRLIVVDVALGPRGIRYFIWSIVL